MTIDRAGWETNQDLITKRIEDDAEYNGHGFSLITVGKFDNEVTVLKALNIETILVYLKSDTAWNRFFLHCRWATGTYKGIPGCHAFHARNKGKDWYIMHNGTLMGTEAYKFDVDSMLAADLTERYGPLAAQEAIQNTQYFANIFYINPTDGNYFVQRVSSGTLYRDEYGNFSTNKIDNVLDIEVEKGYKEGYAFDVEPSVAPKRGSVYGKPDEKGKKDKSYKTKFLTKLEAQKLTEEASKTWESYDSMSNRILNKELQTPEQQFKKPWSTTNDLYMDPLLHTYLDDKDGMFKKYWLKHSA